MNTHIKIKRIFHTSVNPHIMKSRRCDSRAGAIIFDEFDRMLIIHQSASNYWGFPKGHKERGESLQVAAAREVREETGLLVDALLNDKNKLTFGKNAMWVVRVCNPIITIDNHEIDAYRWVTINEYDSYNKSKFIRQAYNKLRGFISLMGIPPLINAPAIACSLIHSPMANNGRTNHHKSQLDNSRSGHHSIIVHESSEKIIAQSFIRGDVFVGGNRNTQSQNSSALICGRNSSDSILQNNITQTSSSEVLGSA